VVKFLTIGEPLVVLASQEVDVSLDKVENFKKYLAGAELNVAVGVQRLGHKTAYISKVGEDAFGHYILQNIKSSGIDTRYLSTTNQALTGFYLKQKVKQGDPGVSYFRKHSAASQLTIGEIKEVRTEGIRLAHLSGVFPALSVTALETFREFHQALNQSGVTTVFDPNLRPTLWESEVEMIQVINELAKGSLLVLPGINEGEILMGSREPERIADFYLNQSSFTEIVVVKLGAEGAFVKERGKQGYVVPGFQVDEVIDTVGAGDGFAVGLESALLEGKTLDIAVKRACAIGALAVQSAGDNDGYPTREELKEFYQKKGYKGDL